MSSSLSTEILVHFEALPLNLQEQVLSLVRTLDASLHRGTPGRQLLRFAGLIQASELAAMSQAIEEGCE